LWKDRRVIDCQFNTLLLRGDNVFAFTAAGQGGAEFRCVDIRTGQLKWKYHSLLRRGQGLIAGNAIVLLGERGHLASLLVSDHSPQLLAFTEQPLMSEPCYCAPAYANGLLYLKDEQRIACFDLRHDRGRDD
jgi:outer membrane protein assembly factor BamB